MRRRPVAIAIALALSSLCSALLGVSPASADVTLGVTPAILDVSGRPGGTGTVEIYVDNDGSEPFDVVSSVFELEAASGSPSAVAWSAVAPSRLSLDAGATGTVTLNLDIPDDTEPGGHYAAVSIATSSPVAEGDPETGVTGRIVVPVLIAVIGDERHPTPEAIPVLKRTALFLERDGSLLSQTEVHNAGGTHIALTGEVRVTLAGAEPGREPVAAVDVPIGRTLPETTRLYPAADLITLEPDSGYEVTLELGETDGGPFQGSPLIASTFQIEMTPQISLADLAGCTTPDGVLGTSVAVVNEGTLGVAPDLDFWAEVPGVGRAAVAQHVSAPLAWPEDNLDISSTIDTPLADGEYVLVAEATYGLEGTVRAELPFSVDQAIVDLPSCTIEAASPAG